MEVTVWFDGACKDNGKPTARAAWGFWVQNDASKKMFYEACGPVEGTGYPHTNNVAEWMGCYEAIKWVCTTLIESVTVRQITVVGDSNLVISQLSKKWKTTPGSHMEKFRDDTLKLIMPYMELKCEHVLRHKNTHADKLSNDGLLGPKSGWTMTQKDLMTAHANAVTAEDDTPKRKRAKVTVTFNGGSPIECDGDVDEDGSVRVDIVMNKRQRSQE